MKHKVLIAEPLSEAAIDKFYKASITTTVAHDLTPEELGERIGEFHGLAVRSKTKVTAALIEKAAVLRVIGRAGIGLDNIDVAAATRAGIVVMNTPEGNATTTAEHTLAMMFALARHIPRADQSTQAGRWEKSKFLGIELAGKTLGVIGCGKIGSIVAERALGLRLNVMVFDPFLTSERAQALGVDKVDWEVLLAAADLITLHTPLTADTREIINPQSIERMKPGVRIINCARGGLIDEASLAEAIRTGKVAGAAVDVFSEEPARESPLFGLDGVVATPHLGASTSEAQEKVATQIAEQMAAYLRNGTVTNSVNIPSLSAEESKRLDPYLELARQLGGFVAQLGLTGIRSVDLDYEGQATEMNTSLVTQACVAGLLAPVLRNINVVSARDIAKERGIEISETQRKQPRNYQTLMSLSVDTATETFVVRGTLFDGNKPRMVEIQGISIEFEIVAHMLFVSTHDKPGMIGAVGGVLADAQINIATLQMGRSHQGGDAMALFGLDAALSRQVLKQVRGLSNVRRAEAISLERPSSG